MRACACVRKIRRDSVVDSGISVLSICTHLSRKSLTSGISDAGRVSGLTHFTIVGGCVGVFPHLQQVLSQVLTDACERA